MSSVVIAWAVIKSLDCCETTWKITTPQSINQSINYRLMKKFPADTATTGITITTPIGQSASSRTLFPGQYPTDNIPWTISPGQYPPGHSPGRFGRVDAFRPKGHGFDSCSSRHIVTLGKVLMQLPVALRREIPAQYPCCIRSASE